MTFSPQAVCFDRTTLVAPIGAYTLAYDSGADLSAIWYTADAFAKPVVWTKGATFAGKYTHIRSASTAGGVLVHSPENGTGAGTINITYAFGTGAASVSSGGNVTITSGVQLGVDNIQFTVSPCATMHYVSNTGWTLYSLHATAASWNQVDCDGNFHSYYGANNISTMPDAQISGLGVNSNSPFTLTLKLTSGAGVSVRYSSDYGATVGSAISGGTTAGPFGDFDIMPVGGASILSTSGQVKIATTLGGAYSNAAGGTLSAGEPVSLALPYRRWPHGATQYNATNPDYLLGASTIISGSCLWMVNGATGALTSVNPVSGATCAGPLLATVWQSSAVCKLAIVVWVGGVQKLYVSTNSGSTWTLSRTIATGAGFLRCRRNDPNGQQLYFIDGNQLWISQNWGTSWVSRALPSSKTGIGLDIYG